MKHVLLAFLVFAYNSCQQMPNANDTNRSDMWWTYLAEYDGIPGSTVVDLKLKAIAPVRTHTTLLVSGVSYKPLPDGSGFPDEAELDFLTRLSTKRSELIAKRTDAIFVGSFTHNGERLDYFYVTDAAGLETALREFYSSECPDRQSYINIKSDVQWDAYLNFLYPNPATSPPSK